MHVRTDARGNSTVALPASILDKIRKDLGALQEGWLQQLRNDPSRFGQIEVEVHHTFEHLADQVVAGLLGDVSQQPALEQACKKSC
jgi:hypothetical protein